MRIKIGIILIAVLLLILVSDTVFALSGSFTINIQNQKVTIIPTLSDDVDYYKFVIISENGFEGSTDWIPLSEVSDQFYDLGWSKEYTVTMWFRSETSLSWYTETLMMPDAPPSSEPVEEEPVEIQKNDFLRKNIFDWVPDPIKNSWGAISAIAILLLIAVLIGRKKEIKKYFYVKKRR
jgi:hypothetical protein